MQRRLEDFLSKDIRKKLYKIIIKPEKASSVEAFSAEIEFDGELCDYEFRVVSSGEGKRYCNSTKRDREKKSREEKLKV